MQRLNLPNGYYTLPPGTLVNLVACLEMRQKPRLRGRSLPPNCRLGKVDADHLSEYRRHFHRIGVDNMWFSRLNMGDDELRAILTHPDVCSMVLRQDDETIGLLELNFREAGQCEIAFFGLVKHAIGTGLGAALMDEAITRAFARPITRLWVHTCHFDHPSALQFYLSSGFTPYEMMIEVHDDPRLTGKLPETAAPHVPLIKR